MKEWLTKNKVLIVGLLSAIILPVYDLITKGQTSTKIIVLAIGVAATGFLGKNLRGQWATIVTIVGTVLATYITQDQTGQPISWTQLILQGILLYLGATGSPAKSIGYEKTAVISQAKKEGEAIVPSTAPLPKS